MNAAKEKALGATLLGGYVFGITSTSGSPWDVVGPPRASVTVLPPASSPVESTLLLRVHVFSPHTRARSMVRYIGSPLYNPLLSRWKSMKVSVC